MYKNHNTRWVPLFALVALFLPALGTAQSSSLSSVVPLGVPAITSASLAGNNQACGLHYTPMERHGLISSLQMVNLDNSQATTLTSEFGEWNPNRELITGVVCPAGQVWFVTTERITGKKSVWKIVDGTPVPFLRPGDRIGGITYIDGATLVGNATRAVLFGQFKTEFGQATMAISHDGQILGNYGNGTIHAACATDKNVATVTEFAFGSFKYAFATRGRDIVALVPNLGNDGSQDTSLFNLTYSVGCSADTAAFAIRSGKNLTVQTLKDGEGFPTTIFSGSIADKHPVSSIWGLTVGTNGNVSFAMRVSVPNVFGQEAIFRICDNKAEAVATEGIDFPRISATSISPMAFGSRLVFFQSPVGGAYEVKQ